MIVKSKQALWGEFSWKMVRLYFREILIFELVRRRKRSFDGRYLAPQCQITETN